MKHIILLICISFFISCRGEDKKAENKEKKGVKAKTSIAFDSDMIDIGEVPEGKQVKIVYKFVNKGPAPLIIYEVKPGCGCTAATWPKIPVKVNQVDSISLVFDSRKRPGIQNKHIVVFYNSVEKAKVLSFKGLVVSQSLANN